MFQTAHQYFLEVFDSTGRVCQSVILDDDAFMACYEDTLFAAICHGQVPNDDSFPTATIEPCRLTDGTPFLSGVTIHIPPVTKQYGLSTFADIAYRTQPASDGDENPIDAHVMDSVLWRLRAEPRREVLPPRRRATLRRQPYPLHRESLDELGLPHLTVAHPPFALLVSKSVIAELRDATVHSLHIERADILTGRVVQDPDGSIVVLVTGRIPARVAGQGTASSFQFSPMTFAAARAEVFAQSAASTIVGWAHNHPACKDCPVTEPYCPSETVFFSLADRQVHRTSFTAPYAIGLVLGKGRHKSPTDPIVRAYAWNHAIIDEQPMRVF